MPAIFFIPPPEDIPATRIDLSFGMRSAMRFHREQIVPGIGGVTFVRQLSWAVVGLYLAAKVPKSAISVANAVEALASKCEYDQSPDEYSFLGKRAFARDRGFNIWDFADLSSKSHYVQITFRQGSVRALPESIGLGFSVGEGLRYNTMELSALGRDLADAFLYQEGGIGRGKTSVGSYLEKWCQDNARPGENSDIYTLGRRLGPSYATAKEKEIVLSRLQSLVTGGICKKDPRRRIRLCDYLKSDQTPNYENLLGSFDQTDSLAALHKEHMLNAEAFEKMRMQAAVVIDLCAQSLPNFGISAPILELAVDKRIEIGLEQLNDLSSEYIKRISKFGPYPEDGHAFARSMTSKKIQDRLRELLTRDGRILQVFDNNVHEGPLYKINFSLENMPEDDELVEADNELHHWPLARLSQFQKLWKDAQ